ncbi:MAG TPA: hypothetical protein VMJ70_08640 [Candidatus Sulfotelmatobacter sp.]|nr:hypothetical protein [Candidatus Sulfotelmatobacter sp.]
MTTTLEPPARRRRNAKPAPKVSGLAAPAGANGEAARVSEALAAAATIGPPEGWRDFVGRWLESVGCAVSDAARGDWEVELSPWLQRKWRRHRVRMVFDAQRPTLPRGAWYTAPGSLGGRKLLEAALEEPLCTRRTALARVPGAPETGIATVCRVRGLSWGPPRLGPVRYERRLAFHAVMTRWGGLPSQESWVVLIDSDGRLVEAARGYELPDLRTREGLYQISDSLTDDRKDAWMANARRHLEALVQEREREWEREIARHRDDELSRLGGFFSARIEEEEERLRRRTSSEETELEGGDATSLKLEWERRAAEVRQRWAIRSEVRLWGLEEWSWPVADLEQEVKAGAMHVRVHSLVDVARGRPALPACPTCGSPAEMLVRVHGSIGCPRCG